MNGTFKAVGSKGVDDDADYGIGIQIIDENKEFTSVSLSTLPSGP